VLKIRSAAGNDNPYAVARTQVFLASALMRIGDYAQAAELATQAQQSFRKSLGLDNPLYLDASSYAATALIALGRGTQALEFLPAPDAAMPSTLAANSRWRFLELQLFAAKLAGASLRETQLNLVINNAAAEPNAPRDVASLLLQAAAICIENDVGKPAHIALAAAQSRLAMNDATQLLEIHQVLRLLLEKPLDRAALIAAKDQLQKRRGAGHYAVELAVKALAAD
jgi:hypothetical protein